MRKLGQPVTGIKWVFVARLRHATSTKVNEAQKNTKSSQTTVASSSRSASLGKSSMHAETNPQRTDHDVQFPFCGKDMVVRRERQGGQFRGCTTFPSCRGTESHKGIEAPVAATRSFSSFRYVLISIISRCRAVLFELSKESRLGVFQHAQFCEFHLLVDGVNEFCYVSARQFSVET